MGVVERTGEAWELPAPRSWVVCASFSCSPIPCSSQKRNQGLFLPAPDPGGGRGRGWAGQVPGESWLGNVSQEYQCQYLSEPQ